MKSIMLVKRRKKLLLTFSVTFMQTWQWRFKFASNQQSFYNPLSGFAMSGENILRLLHFSTQLHAQLASKEAVSSTMAGNSGSRT